MESMKTMNRQEYILLFNSIYPDHFEREVVRGLREGSVFEEMILPLNEFNIHKYDKKFDAGITFGFYNGGLGELKKEVEKVNPKWVKFFDGNQRVYCGYIDKKVASFCLLEDMGVHNIDRSKIKIGGPGCVGTLPEYRNRGIGLTMVKRATQILKEEGYDYSYIHFTSVTQWYGKIGYKTSIKWDKNGVKQYD